MKPIKPFQTCPRLRNSAVLVIIAVMTFSAHAGPGAHGPNGEHLDAPATGSVQGHAGPRVEAKSETFELVGRLEGGVFTLLIDKFSSNEPVLSANVEVEAGATRAKAAFRAEQGDYVVTDPAMLKLLSGPTKQAMVFTIVAGAETDLLDGSLMPATGGAGAEGAHDHGPSNTALFGAAAVGLGLLAGLFFLWRQLARRSSYKLAGGGK